MMRMMYAGMYVMRDTHVVFMYVCTHGFMYVCVYACVCCTRMYMYTHARACMHMYAHECMNVAVCMCKYGYWKYV